MRTNGFPQAYVFAALRVTNCLAPRLCGCEFCDKERRMSIAIHELKALYP